MEDKLNPKDAIARLKAPLHLVPLITRVLCSLGHAEGMVKYGYVNWRVAKVSLSVYMAALERHMCSIMEGEWCDPDTGVPHFAYMLACISIMADAWICDQLVDDRPVENPNAIRFMRKGVPGLYGKIKEAYADKDPTHWTQQEYLRYMLDLEEEEPDANS